MANPLAIKLLDSLIVNALRMAESVEDVDHDSTRGRLREIFVQDLIEPFLPPTWGVSTGIVICADGAETSRAQSGQEDILIFDPSLLPPMIRKLEQTIIPIEAVLAIVEVKSVLKATDYSQAVKHSAEIRAMPSSWRIPQPDPLIEQFRFPTYHVYGFATDMSGSDKSEWDRMIEAHEKNGVKKPVLNSVCCADNQLFTQHHSMPDEFKKYDDPSHMARFFLNAMAGAGMETGAHIDQLKVRNTRYWLLGVLDVARLVHAARVRKMTPVVLSAYFSDK